MVGHLLGAAGAIEFVTCVKEIQDSFVHATVGYTTPDEELDLDYCKEAVQMDVPVCTEQLTWFRRTQCKYPAEKIQ